jgi:hypothetical protein
MIEAFSCSSCVTLLILTYAEEAVDQDQDGCDSRRYHDNCKAIWISWCVRNGEGKRANEIACKKSEAF